MPTSPFTARPANPTLLGVGADELVELIAGGSASRPGEQARSRCHNHAMAHGGAMRRRGERVVVRTRRNRHALSRRTSQLVGASGFAAAAVLPFALWHRAISYIASDFRLEVEYLVTGWTAYTLLALGLLFAVPVVVSIGRSPTSRLYPRSRQAYAGWAVTLYILGFALASQVAPLAEPYVSR